MCSGCVKDGRMTQAELDEAMAAGDKSVIPLFEMNLNDAMVAITEIAGTMAIAMSDAGETESEIEELGKLIATLLLDGYVGQRALDGNPVTPEELASVPDSFAEAKSQAG